MLKILGAAMMAIVASSTALAQTASESNRLFGDSRLVVRDRFSDEIIGKGPDLVFIPGLASSRETWTATAERLRGRYRVHLIQIAGFAGEPARGNASGEVLIPTAEAIDDYLVEQHLTPATVIGHSLGGTTALYLAETHGGHLKKALLIDALPFFGGQQDANATADSVRPQAAKARDAMMASTAPVTRQSLAPQMRAMSKDAATRDRITDWGMASDRSVVARALYDDLTLDLRPGLATIKTPIVLVYPDYVSLGTPAGMMETVYPRVYRSAPTVKPVQVQDSLHFVMLDQPRAFDTILDEFLVPDSPHETANATGR